MYCFDQFWTFWRKTVNITCSNVREKQLVPFIDSSQYTKCQPWQGDISSLLYWHHHRWQRLGVTVKGREGVFVVSVGTVWKTRPLDPPYWEVALKLYTLCRLDPSALTQRNVPFSHEPFCFCFWFEVAPSSVISPRERTQPVAEQMGKCWLITGWKNKPKKKTTSSSRAVAQLAPHHHWTLA